MNKDSLDLLREFIVPKVRVGKQLREARGRVIEMTTVTLPDDLAQLMEKEARRRRLSVPELLRDLLYSKSSAEDAEKPRARSISFAGLIDDPGMVPARRLDEMLEDGWADAIVRDRG